MQTSLYHLILAVEAQLAGIPVARQTEEQEYIVEETLDPEGERVEVGLAGEDVGDEEVGVKDGEAGCEGRTTHIDFILHAVEPSLQ